MSEVPYDPPLSHRRYSISNVPGAPPRGARRQSSSTPIRPQTPIGVNSESDSDSYPIPASRVPIPASPARSTRSLIDVEQEVKDGNIQTAQMEKDLEDEKRERRKAPTESDRAEESSDMENFLAQIFDLTQAVDGLENDVDQIVILRNRIVQIGPREDHEAPDIKSDLQALSNLTTATGQRIVSLETWLDALSKRKVLLKAKVKNGEAGYLKSEYAEIKFQIATVTSDFADAMERIREGAWKEEQRRVRLRQWLAKHIRAREPGIDDSTVKSLLKAAELGAAGGTENNELTSYAGIWALNNPFTELAELTNGMRFLHDDLDREIVEKVTGARRGSVKTSRKSGTSAKPLRQRTESSSRSGVQGTSFDQRLNYISAQESRAEANIRYGYARQAQLERSQSRKKMIIALLAVVIFGLVLLLWLATMRIRKPSGEYYSDEHADDSNYRTPMNLFPPTEDYESEDRHTAVPYSLQYPPAYGEDFTYPNPTATVHSLMRPQSSQGRESDQQHNTNNLAQEKDNTTEGDRDYYGGLAQSMNPSRYEYEYPSGPIGLPAHIKDDVNVNDGAGSDPIVVFATATVTAYSTKVVYTTTQSTLYAAQATI